MDLNAIQFSFSYQFSWLTIFYKACQKRQLIRYMLVSFDLRSKSSSDLLNHTVVSPPDMISFSLHNCVKASIKSFTWSRKILQYYVHEVLSAPSFDRYKTTDRETLCYESKVQDNSEVTEIFTAFFDETNF